MADTSYIVQFGDSLSLISKKFFGDFSQTDMIAIANNIADKNLIQPGQKLLIPGVEEAQVIESNVSKSGSKGKNALIFFVLVGCSILAYRYVKKMKSKKPALNGASSDDVIGKTKSGKSVYENKVAKDYEDFTEKDHMDAADIHYKNYHRKDADGSTVKHGKSSMESHLKAAKHGDYKKSISGNDKLVLLFKKPTYKKLRKGMKVAFPDIDGQHTKIGTIKSKSNGMITLSEGGQYTPDEVRLIK